MSDRKSTFPESAFLEARCYAAHWVRRQQKPAGTVWLAVNVWYSKLPTDTVPVVLHRY